MEHRGKGTRRRDIDDVLDSFGEEDTLDAFLKRKQGVKKACQDTPISDLKVVPISREEEKAPEMTNEFPEAKTNVVGAAGNSSNETSSSPEDPEGQSPLRAARVAVEYIEKEKLAKHEVIDYHIETETIEVPWELAEEGRLAYVKAHDKYIADAQETSAEAAIKLATQYIYDCEKAIYTTKRTQQGARVAREFLLSKLNATERAAFDKLDAEYRAKLERRKPKVAKTKSPVKTEAKKEKEKLSAAMKAVKKYEELGFDKETTTKHLRDAGRLDAETLSAIKKVFGG